MKNRFAYGFLLVALFVLGSCAAGGDKEHKVVAQPVAPAGTVKELNVNSPDSDQYVKLETNMGDIVLKLYRETQGHRKNFINLVMNGYYNGQIFYRVDRGSLIQAGDYTSIKDPDRPDI